MSIGPFCESTRTSTPSCVPGMSIFTVTRCPSNAALRAPSSCAAAGAAVAQAIATITQALIGVSPLQVSAQPGSAVSRERLTAVQAIGPSIVLLPGASSGDMRGLIQTPLIHRKRSTALNDEQVDRSRVRPGAETGRSARTVGRSPARRHGDGLAVRPAPDTPEPANVLTTCRLPCAERNGGPT